MSYCKNESTAEFDNHKKWCSLCYKIFDSNLKSDICQEHIDKGDCNIYNCMKKNKKCIRKFATCEDEQKHTDCLLKEDLKNLSAMNNIQNNKNNSQLYDDSSEDSSLFFKKIRNIAANPWEKNSENDISNRDIESKDASQKSVNDSNLIKSKINSIFSLSKEDCELMQSINYDHIDTNTNGNNVIRLKSSESNKNKNKAIDDQNVKPYQIINADDSSKKDFFLLNETIILADYVHDQNPNKIITQHPEHKDPIKSTLSILKDFNKISIDSIKCNPNNSDTLNNREDNIKESIVNDFQYFIHDNTTLEEILEIVYNETRIAKTALKKIKSGFKKRGWNNAKIIRLLKEKYKNWDFLYDPDIKSICSQSEAICISIENLLIR